MQVDTVVPIIAAAVLTILPGSWIIYGLRPSGIPSVARPAMAVALSPAIVGLQLVALEAIGAPFAVAAIVLVLLNLPCAILLVRHYRTERVTCNVRSWLSSAPLLVLLVAIPVLVWSLTPGFPTYQWETMLHTDVVYTIARDGVRVEEANLAGLSLAYGWVGHCYWSIVGWIGDWAPTTIYPVTNVVWIIVTFVLSYQLGRSGLGLCRSTALLGVALMFLGTNVLGIVLRIVTGYSQWWARYFGDIRYSPFLAKFYAFDTMLWGMALLIALALVYTLALQRRVTPLGSLTVALLVGLGLIYPVLFPAGLVLAGCFLFLIIVRWTKDLPQYTRGEIVRVGFAILLGAIVVWLYLELMTADREVALFAISGRGAIRIKSIRFLMAMGPFLLMAALPLIGFLRRRRGPALLLALTAIPLSAAYAVIDLTDLEYKYVLAATICLAFLAAAAVDPLLRRHPWLGWGTGGTIAVGLVALNLLFVFQAGGHIPGNLDQGAPLEEGSFWIALSPSDPDSVWTTAIREDTPQNTVVIARKPGVVLSALVGRSMYVPSDTHGGHVPGYNLNQRSYLLGQRGYPAEVYEQRLGVVETIYTSEDELRVIEALHYLKQLGRPVAVHFSSRDAYSLHWLETEAIGRELVADGRNLVWLVEDPGTLP